ncbi:DUF5360 family protein [Nocardia sp. NPDC048505]|uniref:DUF5360 family protein n=1 Tax=unclassified Nocardia TaxID=2637762 RepID=UPI0033D8F0F5
MRLRAGKALLLVTDGLLVLYWIAVVLDAIPKDAAFRDYSNPVVQAWNWSFLPLDLAAVVFGFAGLQLMRVGHRLGWLVLTVGLTLTFCAGFMAISFWAYYGDFDPIWWSSNAVLMAVPVLVFGLLAADGEAGVTNSVTPKPWVGCR